MTEILINLIKNAIKFTNLGKILIVLRDLDLYTISIEIMDNGIGIGKKSKN